MSSNADKIVDAVVSPNPLPVIGPLTDVELRDSPVPVTGDIVLTTSQGILNNGTEVLVDATGEQLLTDNENRRKLVMQNRGDSTAWVGTVGVTIETGLKIPPTTVVIFDAPDCPANEIWAICDTDTETLIFVQEVTSE